MPLACGLRGYVARGTAGTARLRKGCRAAPARAIALASRIAAVFLTRLFGAPTAGFFLTRTNSPALLAARTALAAALAPAPFTRRRPLLKAALCCRCFQIATRCFRVRRYGFCFFGRRRPTLSARTRQTCGRCAAQGSIQGICKVSGRLFDGGVLPPCQTCLFKKARRFYCQKSAGKVRAYERFRKASQILQCYIVYSS